METSLEVRIRSSMRSLVTLISLGTFFPLGIKCHWSILKYLYEKTACPLCTYRLWSGGCRQCMLGIRQLF